MAIKSKKITSHFRQGESTPNMELIIQTLINEEIIPNYIFPKNWITSASEIIKSVEDKINTFSRSAVINLSVLIKEITIDDSERIYRMLGIDEESLLNIEEHNRQLLREIITKKYQLERTIIDILDENLHMRRMTAMRIREEYLLSGIKNIGKISKILSSIRHGVRGDVNSELSLLDLNEINFELDKFVVIPKGGINIDIRLNKQEFLTAFVSRIDIFKDLIQKEDLIQKFENRKKKKTITARCYLGSSIFIFSAIFILNLYLFLKFHADNRLLDFSDFTKYFFGQSIYLFTIEIFLFFLAFYFLGLFRSFLKIIELYDSHILLIEADFFYKNDENFQNMKDETALFEMRKENTQKIHTLPEKTFALLNGKTNISESPSSIKVLEDVIEAIKNLIKK